jgi:hypothetical protein
VPYPPDFERLVVLHHADPALEVREHPLWVDAEHVARVKVRDHTIVLDADREDVFSLHVESRRCVFPKPGSMKKESQNILL